MATDANGIYRVLSVVMPLYLAMFLGYCSVTWWKILTPAQCTGINKYLTYLAFPMLFFKVISGGDFYAMNLPFVAADTLQKLLLLIGLALWLFLSRKGTLEWVITAFSVVSLPNTLVIGVPLLDAMYPGISSPFMVQMVVMQIVLWNNVMLLLFEYRAAKKLIETRFPTDGPSVKSIRVDPDVVSLGIPEELETEAEIGVDGHLSVVIKRSLSKSISSSFSDASLKLSSGITDRNQHASELTGAEKFSLRSSSRKSSGHPQDIYDTKKFGSTRSLGGVPECNDLVNSSDDRTACDSPGATARTSSSLYMHVRSSSDEQRTTNGTAHAIHIYPVSKVQDEVSDVKIIQGGHSNNNNNKNKNPPGHVVAKLIISMAWKKFILNPSTGASLLGLTWSLIRVRFKLEMPTILQGCVAVITNTTLGLAMYSLGLFTGLQPRIISCSRTAVILSLAAKFLLAPLMMGVLSLTLGLRGTTLNIAILQATLPLGVGPFVFAQEYGVYPNIMSTGVILGLLVALPVVLVCNFALEKL